MLGLLRHLLSILVLPFMVAVVVPFGLRQAFGASDPGWGQAVLAWLPRAGGALLLALGFLLFGWCVALFARVGQGTLAPWDPTRRLVAVGPYNYVRNPMILGVTLMLAGQALLWGSWALAGWAGLFVLVNHLYFLLSEEPGLEQRFGEPYRAYRLRVPRWVPRVPAAIPRRK